MNYLGDSGGDGTAAFSFPVPAGSNVVILVTQRAIGFGCDNYTLELFGLPCPPADAEHRERQCAGQGLVAVEQRLSRLQSSVGELA